MHLLLQVLGAAAAAFFLFLDGWYLLRVPVTFLYARWLLPTVWDLLEEQSFQGLVLPSDLDFLVHMNNARYLREADVARGVHLMRCGIFRAVRALGAHTVLAASCCRYRRSLRFLERYVVRTRLLGWDERAFVMEQRFISARDSFVCAVVLVRLHVVGASPGKAVEHLCRKKTAIMTPMAIIIAFCVPILILTFNFDASFFIRLGLLGAYSLLFPRPKKDVLGTHNFYSLVLPSDLDVMGHMNNARYLREAELARNFFFALNGFVAAFKRTGSCIVMAASCCRYRRPLSIFEHFVIHTRILGWDERALCMEQLFVTPHNGFVVAVVLTRFNGVNGTPAALMKAISGMEVESPEIPEEVRHWFKYNELNSQKMRAERELVGKNKEN